MSLPNSKCSEAEHLKNNLKIYSSIKIQNRNKMLICLVKRFIPFPKLKVWKYSVILTC